MKKLIAIFALLAMTLSLTACDEYQQIDFDIAKKKDIVLGNEVDSATIKTVGGEELTLDGSDDFYEVFDSINFEFKNGIKFSSIAEIKKGDESRSYINMNSYLLDGADLYEFRAKKDGDGAIAVIEEYSSYKQSAGGSQMVSFVNYSYKDEKAFGGNENGVKYITDKYPFFPQSGTELCDMQSRAVYLRTLIYSTELFARYEAFEINGQAYDFDDFANREYKLYENYIVFKQTAPFLNAHFAERDQQHMYMWMLNSDFSVTQEAYYSVETGKIEFIRIYGETIWHTANYLGIKVEMDIKIYVYELEGSESKQKIEGLIDRIKSSVE
ncbi:MAG: hypothetical protein MR270_07010 [Erysipelotrichaceae bacterium]|nr:hypothetical protein [Erysipelotrichaceae bacterium]